MALNIKQINAFNLVVLRIAGFIEYVQQVNNLFNNFRGTSGSGESPLPPKVESLLTAFTASVGAVDDAFKLSRASDYTKRIADEDTRRDNLYTSLKSQVQMYQKFDFDGEMKTAAETIWNAMKKYAVDVSANYSEESGKLQQMIQELEASSQAEQALQKLGLTSLLQQLKTANEAVRTMMAQRNDERMYQEKAALATARKQADTAYHDLVAMLNAYALTDDDTTRFDELIQQVNELIKYYRLYVVKKKGNGTSSDDIKDEGGNSPEPTPTPSDGSDDNGSTGFDEG